MTPTMDCTYKGQHGSSPQLRGIIAQAPPLGGLQYWAKPLPLMVSGSYSYHMLQFKNEN